MTSMKESILAYIGAFYLMAFDYPAVYELGLTILHFLFFEDMNIPADLLSSFTVGINDYNKYKNK